MAYLNLKAEMARKNVTIEEISDLLKIHRNSVSNKLNGKSKFSIDEAFSVQRAFFPDMETQYLFATEEVEER